MGVGGGRQGWTGGERRPAPPWESGIGYRLEGGGVYGSVNLATLWARWLDVVMIVEEKGRGGKGDNEVVGVGTGVGRMKGDDVGRARWGKGSFSFRLKTGRSPKNRIHLTEGADREFRKKFKCQSVGEQGDDGTGEEKRCLLLKRKHGD